MNTSLVYSLRQVSDRVIADSMDFIIDSKYKYFEISGETYESPVFADLRKKFFNSGKKVFSVYDVLPANLSRNWSASPENIKVNLQSLLIERIESIAEDGIGVTELDLALDVIGKGNEIYEVGLRADMLSAITHQAEESGVKILLPIRFPKAYPKSFEWRYLIMLLSKVFHKNVVGVANVFPFESSVVQMEEFFKKTFYSCEVVRFCFDPDSEGDMTREALKVWLQAFCDQGYQGKIIISPKLDNADALKFSLENLSGLLKPYEFV